MALDIQAPNLSGLAALASGGPGNLNLQPAGALGLQAYQMRQQANANAQQAALGRMQLQQQGELGLRAHITQNRALDLQAAEARMQGREMSLREKQLAMQGGQFQEELGLKRDAMGMENAQFQTTVDMKKKALEEEASQRNLAKLLDQKAETLHKKGAMAAYTLMSIKDAETPEMAHQIRLTALQEAFEKGDITSEQQKQLAKVPISQFGNFLKKTIIEVGMAKEWKDMNPEPKTKGRKPGTTTSTTTDEDGNVVSFTSSPTTPVTTEAQKKVVDKDFQSAQIKILTEDFDPLYLTKAGQGQASISAAAEKYKGIPIVGDVTEFAASSLTGKSPEQRAEFLKKQTSYMNTMNQLFDAYKHDITGAGAGPEEIEGLRKSFLNGEMSPSQFIGALNQARTKALDEANVNKNLLNTGVNTTPSSPSEDMSGIDPGRLKHLMDNGVDRAQAIKYLKGK